MSNEIEKPPVFKKWSGWYILLIASLLVLVTLFYFFAKYYS